MMTQRFDELWTQFLEGEIDNRGLASLQQMLVSEAELLERAADLYEEHRLLGFVLQPFDQERFYSDAVSRIESNDQQFVGDVMTELRRSKPTAAPKSSAPARLARVRLRRAAGLLVATAMSLLVAAGAWVVLGLSGNRTADPESVADSTDAIPSAAIATLLLEENCVWSPSGALGEGKRLHGGRVELESGMAVLRFDGGAELVMVGPAVLDLKSAASVLVHFGDVVVRASDGAEGFVVMTPSSEVVDLGTEFAVKVNRKGMTEVHVMEGEVSYRQLDAPEDLVKILRAGEGISIDKGGRPTAVPMNSSRFRHYVQRMNPRSRTDLLAAYEGFNYSPGVLPLEQSNVGVGWAGPWRKRLPAEQTLPAEDTSPDHFEIVHGQMNVTWPVPGGRMGMLKLPDHSVYYVRPLKNVIRLDQDGVTYFSLMVRETKRPVEQERPRERVRLTFRSLKDYYSQFVSFGHGAGYQPRVRTGDGVLHLSAMVVPREQTSLWIGKIVARAEGEDEIHFRVYGENDALGYAEPATWHVVTRGVVLNSQLDCVLLSSEGRTERVVDELRVGPTWRSVAPMSEATK